LFLREKGARNKIIKPTLRYFSRNITTS